MGRRKRGTMGDAQKRVIRIPQADRTAKDDENLSASPRRGPWRCVSLKVLDPGRSFLSDLSSSSCSSSSPAVSSTLVGPMRYLLQSSVSSSSSSAVGDEHVFKSPLPPAPLAPPPRKRFLAALPAPESEPAPKTSKKKKKPPKDEVTRPPPSKVSEEVKELMLQARSLVQWVPIWNGKKFVVEGDLIDVR